MKRHILKALTILCILLLSLSASIIAVNAAPVDMQKDLSLTLVYKHNNTFYDSLDIKIYRVADVQADYSFDLARPFASYPINIYKIQSQDEWRTVTKTLKSYIVADKITETAAGKTDKDGKVVFDSLRPGIYLTLGFRHRSGNYITEFEDSLIIIPRLNADESFSYDVTAYPKCDRWSVGGGGPKDPKTTYKVVKQWKDNGQSEKRAKSIKIDIFRNGVLKETVTLSSSNNWKYSWKTEDDGSEWTVIERDVPKDYTVGISESGTTFIITNTYDEDTPKPPDDNPPPEGEDPPPPDDEDPPPEGDNPPPSEEDNPPSGDTPTPPGPDNPTPPGDGGGSNPPTDSESPNPPGVPQTGDTSSIYQYIILMCLSGLLLIILSIGFKRKKS